METIEGRGMSPVLVMMHVERLPDTSMTHALMRGGPEHFGWGRDRHMLADIFDMLTFNTQATGNWRKKPPEMDPWPRPEIKGAAAEATAASTKPTSLNDVWARLNRT